MSLEPHYSSILTDSAKTSAGRGWWTRPSARPRPCSTSAVATTRTLEEVVGEALFTSDNSEMVLVKNIELYSLCEHHMLPFIGKAHVAYMPKGKVLGLSRWRASSTCSPAGCRSRKT